MVDKGCPEGMYPLDSSFEANVYDTFEELRSAAENASDILNLPLSWFFDEGEDGDYGPSFTLVFLMPRKYGQTWSMRTHSFDRPTVQAWLDTWLRGEIDRWFGWADQGKPRISDGEPSGWGKYARVILERVRVNDKPALDFIDDVLRAAGVVADQEGRDR